jgi:aspartate/methionine/tyrosine aminotransferase
MKYRRMPIEEESPEQFGYDEIRYNLAESSVSDRRLSDLGVDLGDILLCYGDHLGTPELREQIAAQGGGLHADDVLVSAGAAGALFIVATSLLEAGDHLVVAHPNYATNLETPFALGCDVTHLKLDFENGFRIDLAELESVIRGDTRLVSLTSPHNPSGAQMTAEELDQVVDLVESKGCTLLFDETYRDLAYEELLPVAATLSPRAISVSSLSKTFGIPGIRIGWLICRDPELKHRFLCAREQIGICGSVVDEVIALAALEERDAWRLEIGRRTASALDAVKAWLADEDRIEWIEPQGGVVCFPRIRSDVDVDLDLFYKALFEEHGTYVGPGHWFGFPRSYFRIGFVWPTLEELELGLRGISKALDDAAKSAG